VTCQECGAPVLRGSKHGAFCMKPDCRKAFYRARMRAYYKEHPGLRKKWSNRVSEVAKRRRYAKRRQATVDARLTRNAHLLPVHVGPAAPRGRIVLAVRALLARRARGRRPRNWWAGFVAGRCAWCREHFVARAADLSLPAMYCSKRCLKDVERARYGRFTVPTPLRLAIYERDAFTCQLCFTPVDIALGVEHPQGPTLDHIEFRSRGGADDPGNLRLAHRLCNSIRQPA
jgi:hypothetical protein